MKFHALALLSALQLTAVAAERLNQRHVQVLARRDPPSQPPAAPSTPPASPSPPANTPPPAPSSPPAPASPPAPGSPTPNSPTSTTGTTSRPASSGTTTAAPTPTITTPTGPPALDTGTAIAPLANITSGMPTKAYPAFTNPFQPGATPPVQGAPVLPKPFVLSADWPDRDKVPPTNSPEVQAWLKELDGHTIPALQPTVDGSCASDPALAADGANRGWWTCGGAPRITDIVACPDKLTWGVSFDDGPSFFTPVLLDYLHKKDISATFFVVGSRVYEHANILIDEYMAGHEISIHTWSHRPLTSLTTEQIVAELGWTRKIIKTVLGVTPTTMRPPYGDIDDRVRAIALAMGMVPILWTQGASGKFDTNDWRVAGGLLNGTTAFNSFETILNDASNLNTGFIVLQHDLFEITVDLAVGYTLDAAVNHQPKYNLEAIGKCSKIPDTNLYLESNKNTTFPYPSSSGGVDVSGDGKVDTKSGDGGATAASAAASAAFINTVPLVSSVFLVSLGLASLLL